MAKKFEISSSYEPAGDQPEAIRLLCLRSGARIRRADSLASAHRHLRVYRPSIVIVDMGLPDGSGLDLIREMDAARPRVRIVLAISGDTERLRGRTRRPLSCP